MTSPCYLSLKNSCSQTFASCLHSRWADAALIVCIVGALAIAIAATAGPSCAISAAMAFKLSLAMYVLAGFFLLTLVIKQVLAYLGRKASEENSIT